MVKTVIIPPVTIPQRSGASPVFLVQTNPAANIDGNREASDIGIISESGSGFAYATAHAMLIRTMPTIANEISPDKELRRTWEKSV